MKKGGGRRYYRPEDIALLSGIRALLYDDGLSIKVVQAELKTQGVPAIAARGRQEIVTPVTPESVDTVETLISTPLANSAEENALDTESFDDVERRSENPKERENNGETHERLSGALQKLLNARERLNDTLQKH